MLCKPCISCGKTLSLDEFYAHPRMKDGRLNKCKPCVREAVRSRRYGPSREAVLQYDRERAREPHRIEHQKKIKARWQQSFPERRAAQIALGNAIRDGRVEKWPTCSMPECSSPPEAHHVHYGLPLDVVWLCPAHHKQLHAQASREAETA